LLFKNIEVKQKHSQSVRQCKSRLRQAENTAKNCD